MGAVSKNSFIKYLNSFYIQQFSTGLLVSLLLCCTASSRFVQTRVHGVVWCFKVHPDDILSWLNSAELLLCFETTIFSWKCFHQGTEFKMQNYYVSFHCFAVEKVSSTAKISHLYNQLMGVNNNLLLRNKAAQILKTWEKSFLTWYFCWMMEKQKAFNHFSVETIFCSRQLQLSLQRK